MAAYEGGARRRPPPPLSKPRAALLALAQQDAEHYLRGAGAEGLSEAIRAVAVAGAGHGLADDEGRLLDWGLRRLGLGCISVS